MYKIVNIDFGDTFIGKEKAVIEFANDRKSDNGDTEVKINNLKSAIKYLQDNDFEVSDIGNHLKGLKLKENEILVL